MKCQFCERESNNKGSLIAHQMRCHFNPDKVAFNRSPLSGHQKGNPSPLKGIKKTDEVIARTIDIVENGKLPLLTEYTARKHAKRYLIHTRGHECFICTTSEWQDKPVPLVCDHISGDSTDNRIENFRLVCCNCDAQLPTFKSKNRGKGRAYDREYRQKKSAAKVTT